MEKYKIDENYRFDEADPRDLIYTVSKTSDLPASVDLRQFDREIENQLNLGSCVANASLSVLELIKSQFSDFEDYSRLFQYYELRKPYQDLHGQDKGAYTRDGFKIPNKVGVVLESDYPYNPQNVNKEPPADLYRKAGMTKVLRYMSIKGDRDTKNLSMKHALKNGMPVLIGMSLTEQFYQITGTFNQHKYEGTTNTQYKSIGGHAMCVVGYDDALNGWIVENSWGAGWGNKGYFLLDYSVGDRDLRDRWVCTAFDDFDSGFKELTINPKDIHLKYYAENDGYEFQYIFDKSDSNFASANVLHRIYPNGVLDGEMESYSDGESLKVKFNKATEKNSRVVVGKIFVSTPDLYQDAVQNVYIWLYEGADPKRPLPVEPVEPADPVQPTEPTEPKIEKSDNKTKTIIFAAVILLAAGVYFF